MSIESSSSLHFPLHINALLTRLHSQSSAEDPIVNSAISDLQNLRAQNPLAGNTALHNLMLDKFVALDCDKCEFVYQLMLATGAKTAVEVGTSFGVSTIYLALAVAQNDPQTGKVIATEIESTKAAKAREHWAEAGEVVSKHVELRVGDLKETLKTDVPEVDFLLLDVWAALALPALKVVQPKLRLGAVIISDNTSSMAPAYKGLLEYLRDPDSPFTNLTLPFSNGLEMIWGATALPALKLMQHRLRAGAVVIAANNTASRALVYKQVLEYLRDPNGPFTHVTLPYTHGLDMSVYLPQD